MTTLADYERQLDELEQKRDLIDQQIKALQDVIKPLRYADEESQLQALGLSKTKLYRLKPEYPDWYHQETKQTSSPMLHNGVVRVTYIQSDGRARVESAGGVVGISSSVPIEFLEEVP